LLLEIVHYGEFFMVFFKLAESALPMGNRTVESALSIKFLTRASRNIPHFQGCGLNIGLDDVVGNRTVESALKYQVFDKSEQKYTPLPGLRPEYRPR